jgi:RHS repeat-associated protein
VETVRDSYGVRGDGGSGVEVVEPYGFTGHAEDGSGEVWGRARYYSPVDGGWLQEDSVYAESRYCYGRSSPFVYADSTGRNPEYSVNLQSAECRAAFIGSTSAAVSTTSFRVTETTVKHVRKHLAGGGGGTTFPVGYGIDDVAMIVAEVLASPTTKCKKKDNGNVSFDGSWNGNNIGGEIKFGGRLGTAFPRGAGSNWPPPPFSRF